MNKRKVSGLILRRIPAGLFISLKAVATGTAPGKMPAVPSLTTTAAPPAGNSPALSSHPRDMNGNKITINGG